MSTLSFTRKNRKLKNLRNYLAVGSIVLLATLFVRDAIANVISPLADANVEGNSNNFFPFNIGVSSSQRYEQVYAGSEFGSSPLTITALAFRPDSLTGFAFSSTLPNVSIFLSTTPNSPDALNPNFAANEGPDLTLVHSGPLALSSTFSGGSPKNFDIVINLTTAFTYNPLLGNLLLDVLNFGGGSTTPFNADFTLGDAVSRLFTPLSPNGVNSPTGISDTLGLVTEFVTTTATPEPSSLLLLGIAITIASVVRHRGRRRT